MRLIGIIVVTSALALTAGCSKDKPNDEPDNSPGTNRRRATTRPAPALAGKDPVIVIETSMGTIKAELWARKAPITVKNFLRYVDEKHFDNLIFHRVKKGFMIQGGGFDVMMRQRTTHEQIKNEATADKKHLRGTLGMARTGVVDSATSGFFINLVDNGFLDHKNETSLGFGYCAFGKVTEGMDVVDKIGAVPVKFNKNPQPEESEPIDPVLIKSIRRGR